MKDNIEELKCLLQWYEKKNTYKAVIIAVFCALAVFAAVAAIVYFVRGGCCCDDDFCDFDDDFDDDEDDDEDDDFEKE